MLRGNRDMSSIVDTVHISATKGGFKFSTTDEIGSINVTVGCAVRLRECCACRRRGSVLTAGSPCSRCNA